MSLPPRILPVTPDSCAVAGLLSYVRDLEAIYAAGARGVLLREPSLNDRKMLELARSAREIFHDGWLGIHDRVHVGKLVSADAVHLSFRSLRARQVRGSLAMDVSLGLSHHLEELNDQSMEGDYRFVSPVFPTISKPSHGSTLGLAGLQSASLLDRTWALGGVTAAVVREVLACGVAGVAAIGGIFSDGRAGQNMEAMLNAGEL